VGPRAYLDAVEDRQISDPSGNRIPILRSLSSHSGLTTKCVTDINEATLLILFQLVIVRLLIF
jgi:hypothetical protein